MVRAQHASVGIERAMRCLVVIILAHQLVNNRASKALSVQFEVLLRYLGGVRFRICEIDR